jgi:copper chaperone CopZ
MVCDNCVRSVKDAIGRVPGVIDVSVELESGRVIVSHTIGSAGQDRLRTAVEDAGFDFNGIVG